MGRAVDWRKSLVRRVTVWPVAQSAAVILEVYCLFRWPGGCCGLLGSNTPQQTVNRAEAFVLRLVFCVLPFFHPRFSTLVVSPAIVDLLRLWHVECPTSKIGVRV